MRPRRKGRSAATPRDAVTTIRFALLRVTSRIAMFLLFLDGYDHSATSVGPSFSSRGSGVIAGNGVSGASVTAPPSSREIAVASSASASSLPANGGSMGDSEAALSATGTVSTAGPSHPPRAHAPSSRVVNDRDEGIPAQISRHDVTRSEPEVHHKLRPRARG